MCLFHAIGRVGVQCPASFSPHPQFVTASALASHLLCTSCDGYSSVDIDEKDVRPKKSEDKSLSTGNQAANGPTVSFDCAAGKPNI